MRIADWHLVYTFLHHATDAVNQPGLGHDCWLGKSGLVGCLTVQKLDCVRSAMCLRTVLVEDKHVMIKLQCDSCISFYSEIT